MTPIRKSLTILCALALAGMFFLGATGNAAATQTGPSFGSGNRWAYSVANVNGGTNTSMTLTIEEQTALTLGTTSYPVWHVSVQTVQPAGGGTLTSYSDLWVTVDGIRLAKLVTAGFPLLGNTTTTYAPPAPQAVFPLSAGNSWSIPSQETVRNNLINSTFAITSSGIVNGETAVTVPAGTYTAAVIRSPSSGNPYTLSYYSEQAGWFVRVDNYNGAGRLTTVQNLTSTNYNPGLFGISNVVWIALLTVLLIVVVAAVVLVRRRRPPMRYAAQTPYPPAPPSYPPQQPPQQGPPPPG